jgi:hypothetical protein
MVLASSEPVTALAPAVAAHLRRETTFEHLPRRWRGRALAPTDVGLTIVPLLRLRSVEIAAAGGAWVSVGPLAAVVTGRPQVLGVGGLLGADILIRFRRLEYDIGPPDALVLEQA